MEKPLNMQELHEVAKVLSKGKVLGPNWMSLEFFLANWDIVEDTQFKNALQLETFIQDLLKGGWSYYQNEKT